LRGHIRALGQTIEPKQRPRCGRREHGRNTSRVARRPSVQKLERFRTAHFADHNPLGDRPKRTLEELL